jgi:hypothetical protein
MRKLDERLDQLSVTNLEECNPAERPLQQPFWYAVSKDERIEYVCARVLRDVRSHWVRVDMLPKIQV